MFRAKLPSIFITCHKMPCLPRNLYVVTTWRSPDNARFAKNTQHDTSEVLRLPRKMTMEVTKVLRLPRNMQLNFSNHRKKYCACHTKRLSTCCDTCWNATKCHAYAKRSYWNQRHGHSDLTREVANGCGRLWTVANGCGRLRTASGEHNTPLTPKPPEWNGNPCSAFRKN